MPNGLRPPANLAQATSYNIGYLTYRERNYLRIEGKIIESYGCIMPTVVGVHTF
jgi:hypothetical protein